MVRWKKWGERIENEKEKKIGYTFPGEERVFTRKAAFHYGWDWGPKISPIGIWRKVELQSWNDCKINNIYVMQDYLTDSLADLTVSLVLVNIICISQYLPFMYASSCSLCNIFPRHDQHTALIAKSEF